MLQDRSIGLRKQRFRMIRASCATSLKCALFGVLVAGVSGGPIVDAQQALASAAAEKQPAFEVASIKPTKPDDNDHGWHSNSDRLTIEGYSLRDLIVSAYGLKTVSQVLGGPDWIDKKHFDIEAKVDDSELARLKGLSREDRRMQWNLMLQSLLTDRFGLSVSRGKRKLPAYTLVVAKSGIKFKTSTPNEKNHDLSVRNTAMTANATSMDSLADYLTTQPEIGDRLVQNRTGLTGDYDFKLNWARDRGDGIPPDAAYPGLFTALQEQLGLKLESQKSSVEVVIVDTATEPALD
jgi:uncharacterized protein (TIGR03435 family)